MNQKSLIIDAKRSSIGSFGGSLSEFNSPALASKIIKDIITNSNIDGDHIDEVILGNVLSAGIG